MKKILKLLGTAFCVFMMAFMFYACDEDADKKILVNELSLSKTEIVLYTSNTESTSEDIEVFFKPENANSLDVQFFSYDETLIKVEPKANSQFVFTVTAINFEVQDQTTLGVRMKGNTNVQANCVVKIKKIKQKLDAPTNIEYKEDTKQLVWEEPACASFEDFNGYEVEIFEEGVLGSQKIVCPTTNSLNIDAQGKKITARVKTLSRIKSYDSEYSANYTFKVLDDVETLEHHSGLVTWGEVVGVSGYKYTLNGNLPVILDKQIRNYSQTFSTPGKYSITLEEIVEDEINQNGDVSCYVFAGKSKTIFVTKFETPVLNFDSYFTWEEIISDGLMPENYELLRYDEESQEFERVTQTKSLSYMPPEDLSVGTHTYKLRAVGNGEDTLSSEYSAVKIVNKIEAPTNLRVENGVITWDRVSSAIGYNLTISGRINGTNITQVAYISQPDQTHTKVQFALGNGYSGEYRIKVASVGSEEATLNSANTEEIVVTKLLAPEKASFTLTNNVIEWAEQTGASRYKLVLNINNEEIIKEVEENRYVIDIPLEAGEISLKLCAIGSNSKIDNKYFLTGEYSQKVYAKKLAIPELTVQGGKIVWTTPTSTLGFVLHINNGTDLDQDFDMGMQTSFDFYEINSEIFGNITHFGAGTYNVSIKAIGGNAGSGFIGTFDSDVSEELQVTKRETPQVSLKNGEIEVITIDEASNTQEIKVNNTDGSVTYSYYSLGDDTEYIRSDVSNEITVISRTKDVNFRMENGVLYWDEIGTEYEGATYEFKLNGNIVEDITTQTSKDFSEYDAGNYSVSIRVIGTTSGIHTNLILTNSQTDTFTFKKLAKTELSVLTAQDILQSLKIDENKLPGTIIWKEVESALGYRLTIKHSGNTSNLDVHQNFFNLTNYQPGTYTISIKAYGNNGNIISSDESDELVVEKLEAPTNLAINNQGEISWDINSSYMGSMVNLRVIFAFVINGNYYTFYNFSEIATMMMNPSLDSLTVFNKTECDFNKLYSFDDLTKYAKFPSGNYTVYAITIPLNYQEETEAMISQFANNNSFVESILKSQVSYGLTDTMSNPSQSLAFTKLEQPQGLRIDQDENGDYIASWSENYDTHISKYQISIKEIKNNNENDEAEIIDINSGRSFNLNEYLSGKSISNYRIAVRALTDSENYIYSDFGNPVDFKMLNHLNITIKNGKLEWSKIEGAQKYILTFENIDTHEKFDVEFNQDETQYAMSLADDERFVAGTYNIKAKVIGNDSSENLSMFYMDTFDIKDYGSFKKLSTPTNLHVNKGVVVYECLDVPSNFNLYFTGNISEIEGKINNGTKLEYELEEKFQEGEYGLTIQAMGGEYYIDSEVSASIVPETVIKLSVPTARIENGLLKWTSVENSNGYLIRLSGAKFYINDGNGEYIESNSIPHFDFSVTSVNSIDLSKELTATDGTKFKIHSGEYSVQIKALGTDITYLNSNFSKTGNVKYIELETELEIENGILTWDLRKKIDNGQTGPVYSGDAPNGIYLFVKIGDASDYEEPILISDISNNTYEFKDEKYNGKQLEVYLQIIGDKSKVISNSVANINSSMSNVVVIEKLSTPTGTAIVSTPEQGCFGRYTFDACEKVGVEYEVKIIITSGNSVKEISKVISNNYIDLNSEDLGNIEIGENTQFGLSVRYLGGENYINSEFSEELTIVVPKTPTLQLVMDEHNRFTGKVIWDSVDSGNVETEYKVYVQYIPSGIISDISSITEEDWITENIGITLDPYFTTETKYYVHGKGYYRFSIASVLSIGDSGNQITSKISEYSQPADYSIFSQGSGEIDNPFMINSVDSFNAIRFNLTAHYKLANDISFEGQTLYAIGFEDDMFTGSFDGNGKKLSGITKSDVTRSNALFNYVGKTGVIKNVIIEDVSITNGTYIGGIVGYNMGTIQNVVVGSAENDYLLNPISTFNSTTLVGGIAGYNLGTIDNCINYLTIAPKNENAEVYTGGIAGQNNGTITNCKNYGSIGGTGESTSQIASNMSGGIVGYNEKKVELEDIENLIQNCYNYGNVYAISRNNKNISQSAYAGGIVAFNSIGTIDRCFNDNSNRVYTESGIRSQTVIFAIKTATDCQVYVGGLVGFNEKKGNREEGIVTNCYTLSNVRRSYEGTSDNAIYSGAIFGLNQSTREDDISTILYFTFNNSIDSAGMTIPSNSEAIYGYKQGKSGDFNNFKTAVKNSLGIDLATIV